MKLAVNYSCEADALCRAGAVDVDLFKCPDWGFAHWEDVLRRAQAVRPVYIHFNLQAGRGEMLGTDWNAVQGLRKRTSTPYVNIHLSPRVADFPDVAFDEVGGRRAMQVVDTLVADVIMATKIFGPENVIVENIPWWANSEGFLRIAVEPETMHHVLKATGCGFLLDLSHARIAAHYLGRDAKEYIEAFPLDRLCELHNTGLAWEGERLMDHLPMSGDDWVFLDWAIARIRSGDWSEPWALAFEYGGLGPKFAKRSKQAALAADLPRIGERLQPLRQHVL